MNQTEGLGGSDPDRHALLTLVAGRYRAALNAFFRRRLREDAHQCDDLTQDVFVRLARQQARQGIDNLEPYVFRTAASVLVDHLRRRAVRPEGRSELFDDALHAPEDFSPERVLLGKEEVARLMDAIMDLPARARQALLLFRFEDLKQAEIAERMGISVSAVEKHIKLGMIRIADALDDRE